MRPECIPKPTKEKWELTALEYERRANFPHCLGAVDGKHIRIIKPEHSGSMFYNNKESPPVVLIAVVLYGPNKICSHTTEPSTTMYFNWLF